MSESREQKLVDLCFAVALNIHSHQKAWKDATRDEVAEWVSDQLKGCGFPTQSLGSSWGVLIKRTRNERLETIRSALEDAALAIYEAAVGEPH